MKDQDTFEDLENIKTNSLDFHFEGLYKLSKIGSKFAEKDFYEIEFILHNSLLKDYQEKKLDIALVSGIFEIQSAASNIENTFKLIDEMEINIVFNEKPLKFEKDNTVKITFKYGNRENFYITGTSLGNNNINIRDINGDKVELTGDSPIIMLKYKDRKGVLSELSTILANKNINIATLKVSREKGIATLVCELDSNMSKGTMKEITELKGMSYIKLINKDNI